MPTYADYDGWVISTIAGRFEVTADRINAKSTGWTTIEIAATRKHMPSPVSTALPAEFGLGVEEGTGGGCMYKG